MFDIVWLKTKYNFMDFRNSIKTREVINKGKNRMLNNVTQTYRNFDNIFNISENAFTFIVIYLMMSDED